MAAFREIFFVDQETLTLQELKKWYKDEMFLYFGRLDILKNQVQRYRKKIRDNLRNWWLLHNIFLCLFDFPSLVV